MSLKYYQAGHYTFVFHASSNDRQEAILQLSKFSDRTDLGEVLANDFDNLSLLHQIDPQFVPEPYLLGKVDFKRTKRNISLTEFCKGYFELHRDETNNPYLYTITSVGNQRFWHKEESQPIFDNMIKILAHYYFSSYNPETNEGLLIGDVKLNAGDFLINHNDDLKLITARSLSYATPQEFLYYLLSNTQPESDQAINGKVYGLFIDENNRFQNIYDVVLDCMNSFFEEPEEILQDWISQFKHIVKDKNTLNMALVKFAEFDKIPPAYRGTMEMIGYAYSYGTEIHFLKRMHTFRNSIPAQKFHDQELERIVNGVNSLVL